jgi:hypothetical protein
MEGISISPVKMIPLLWREDVKKSPPILGGDEARQGFGGGKGHV